MEDGDTIDAHLQQACTRLISYDLYLPARPFSSGVAHPVTYDRLTLDTESQFYSTYSAALCSINSIVCFSYHHPIYNPRHLCVIRS